MIEDDVRAIERLKARYCRTTDTKQWDLFRECLTEDFSASFEGMPRSDPAMPTSASFSGRDWMISIQSEALKDVVTIHQVFLPEIVIESASEASGIWAFRDHLRMPSCIFTGYGHYYENYVKQEGVWRIARLKVTRLYVEEQWK